MTTRSKGPMVFLAEHIVKAMVRAGYPAKIYTDYRSPQQQNKEFAEGDTKARAWQSPHQFWEAVDIVHPSLYWKAPEEYWKTLGVCVRTVEAKFGVELEWGGDWGWDFAHVEIKSWREIRKRQEDMFVRSPEAKSLGITSMYYVPERWELDERFRELIPRQYWLEDMQKAYPAK